MADKIMVDYWAWKAVESKYYIILAFQWIPQDIPNLFQFLIILIEKNYVIKVIIKLYEPHFGTFWPGWADSVNFVMLIMNRQLQKVPKKFLHTLSRVCRLQSLNLLTAW